MVSYSGLAVFLFALCETTDAFSVPRAFHKHGLSNRYKSSTINQSTSTSKFMYGKCSGKQEDTEVVVDPTDAKIQAVLTNPEAWTSTKLFDWDKWYANDPDGKLSRVFDTPLRYGLGKIDQSSPKFDKGPAAFFLSPKLSPEQIADTLKPNVGEITGDLFEKILGPAPDSSVIPEPFRNALLWMEGNHFGEELVSFNRWAWRPQSEEKGGRVIALGSMATDWTNDPTMFGLVGANTSSFISLQQSPCKKWYVFGIIFVDLDTNKVLGGGITNLKFYVVQEDDKFVDRFGNPVAHMTPGSLLRLNWGTDMLESDNYDCSPANLTLEYTPRKVATYNEETGEIEKVSPNYEALMYAVANKPPEDFTSFEYMTRQERYDMVMSMVQDKQLYRSALTPPSGDAIENL